MPGSGRCTSIFPTSSGSVTVTGQQPFIPPPTKSTLTHSHSHRTLLNAPITPFVVVFGQIIAQPATSDTDLHLLAEFVATLKALCRFSDGMIKMFRLCDVFCKVATLYVQAKRNETQQVHHAAEFDQNPWFGQPALDDIDGYLSTMGFVPQLDAGSGYGAMGSAEEFDASFLLDWYRGSNSLVGLLEQDVAFMQDGGYGYDMPGTSM